MNAVSEREWKPGDVAAVGGQRVFRHGGEFAWTNDFGSRFATMTSLTARPLIVIDPEDREAVERLTEVYKTEFYRGKSYEPQPSAESTAQRTDAMQAALRSLLTPERPDEPTLPGALVRERDQRVVWVRTTLGARPGEKSWRVAHAFDDAPLTKYDDIPGPLEALHEGWSE